MKKLFLTLSALLAVSGMALADMAPQITVSPISPVFHLDKNEVQQTITVSNTSQNVLVCTPTIFNDPMFVNPKYYAGDSLFSFPQQFQLAPGASGSFKLYVYNTQKLVGDGEFDAILNVKTQSVNAPQTKSVTNGASFVLVQQGVVELFKGTLVQNMTLTNLAIQNNVPLSVPVQSGSATVMQNVVGCNITGNVANSGNVHTLYKIDYTLYDVKGNVIGNGSVSDTVIRNTTNPLKITAKVNNVAKVSLALTFQDITTKNYGSATQYSVVAPLK